MSNYPFNLTEEQLALCRELALRAAAKGNPAVGCLIIRHGEIVGQGEEAAKSKADITCHAEIEALRDARARLGSADLSGCLLLTTHEPCVMCSYAIRFHRISTVVYKQAVAHLGGMASPCGLLLTEEVPPHWAPPPEVMQFEF